MSLTSFTRTNQISWDENQYIRLFTDSSHWVSDYSKIEGALSVSIPSSGSGYSQSEYVDLYLTIYYLVHENLPYHFWNYSGLLADLFQGYRPHILITSDYDTRLHTYLWGEGTGNGCLLPDYDPGNIYGHDSGKWGKHPVKNSGGGYDSDYCYWCEIVRLHTYFPRPNGGTGAFDIRCSGSEYVLALNNSADKAKGEFRVWPGKLVLNEFFTGVNVYDPSISRLYPNYQLPDNGWVNLGFKAEIQSDFWCWLMPCIYHNGGWVPVSERQYDRNNKEEDDQHTISIWVPSYSDMVNGNRAYRFYRKLN